MGVNIRFHVVLDYGVWCQSEHQCAAAGSVVFTGPLTAMGNATFIDHGPVYIQVIGIRVRLKVVVEIMLNPSIDRLFGATGGHRLISLGSMGKRVE